MIFTFYNTNFNIRFHFTFEDTYNNNYDICSIFSNLKCSCNSFYDLIIYLFTLKFIFCIDVDDNEVERNNDNFKIQFTIFNLFINLISVLFLINQYKYFDFEIFKKTDIITKFLLISFNYRCIKILIKSNIILGLFAGLFILGICFMSFLLKLFNNLFVCFCFIAFLHYYLVIM